MICIKPKAKKTKTAHYTLKQNEKRKKKPLFKPKIRIPTIKVTKDVKNKFKN